MMVRRDAHGGSEGAGFKEVRQELGRASGGVVRVTCFQAAWWVGDQQTRVLIEFSGRDVLCMLGAMRSLAQPGVLKSAMLAALISSLVCLPRIAMWPTRAYPIWYLEAILFLGGIVLWAFVFGWHSRYTGRPVFTWQIEPTLFRTTTLTGLGTALALYWVVDPALRSQIPEDYPKDLDEWLAMTLFSLGFTQLFLVFAPFAWLVRLFRQPSVATVLTVLFGVIVLLIKHQTSPAPVAPWLLGALITARVVVGFLGVVFFWKGGIPLVCWWTLLLQSRHLLKLGAAW